MRERPQVATAKSPHGSWSTLTALGLFAVLSLLNPACGPAFEWESLSVPISPPTGSKTLTDSTPVDEVSNRVCPAAHISGSHTENEYDTVFSFLEHLDRAHVRAGGLIIDFGKTGRHKHTLGNGPSGFLNDFVKDGRSYSSIRQGTARILFDAFPDESDSGTIIISGIAGSHKDAHVHLNGKWIGQIVFDQDQFSTAELEFGESLFAGQNEILIGCGDRDPGPRDDDDACLSIDYLKVVPRSIGEPQTRGSLEDEDDDSISVRRSPDEIELSDGDSVTFNLPLPEQARVLIEEVFPVGGNDPGLEVLVMVDGREQQTMADLEVDAPTGDLEITLGNPYKPAAAIIFRATGGDIVIRNPRLAVPRLETSWTGKQPRATNFILVVIDTLRADRLRLYNRKSRVLAPAIERIGLEATVFDRAWSQASWTKPSVATLLTGLFPGSHSVQRHRSRLPESVSMASAHFQGLNFATAGFVANGYISEEFGFRRGWDYWADFGSASRPNHARNVFSDASDWLGRHGREKPFFMYVHTVDPHAPYTPPKVFWKAYDSRPYNGIVRPRETADLLKQIKTSHIAISRRDRQRLEALYDGEISYHDGHLARFMQAMRTHGFTEDTLLVVTADHGEEFFDHGGVGHSHSLFEELIHVPLIVRLPGAQKGVRRRLPVDVQLADVLPTACEVLGVECPERVQGRSLVPLLAGGRWDGYPRASFAELPDRGLHAVRMGDLKAVYHQLSPEHYDLSSDRAEQRDISDESSVAKAMLRDALGLHLSRFPVPSSVPDAAEEHREESVVISSELALQLKALGYTDE